MMPKDRNQDGGPNERELATPGDKNAWERTVDRTPSDEGDDPKTTERRQGDMSVREGGPGKRPPRGPQGR
jgi:hypothetical protein